MLKKIDKKEIENAVKTIIKAFPTINFVFDENHKLIVVPTILTKDCTTKTSKIGKLEYQVSDGFAGDRSNSSDAYSLNDAYQEVTLAKG